MTRMIQLAHGGGGRVMHEFLERHVIPLFRNPALEARHDGAVLPVGASRIAFTTDSYVVRPLFFPGGDLGSIAVNGTINDLAMCGARPLALSASLILEEGLPFETLDRILRSMREAAEASRVPIVTGDTKVVDRGKADGIFVNTAGVGVVEREIAPSLVREEDAVIVSGDLGRHGMAVMGAREGLEFESEIESDTAPLWPAVERILGLDVHCLRDLTRGGLASALVEISESANRAIAIDETLVPVREEVRGACEILGLDPLYVANEGRFVAFVAPDHAARALEALGPDARRIGEVVAGRPQVTLRTPLGTHRIVEMFSGEQLPRIC